MLEILHKFKWSYTILSFKLKLKVDNYLQKSIKIWKLKMLNCVTIKAFRSVNIFCHKIDLK